MTATKPPPKPGADATLNAKEAAEYLSIGRTTLAALLAAGKIKHARPSPRVIQIKVGDLDLYRTSVTTGGSN